MANTALLNGTIRVLNASNIVDMEFPYYLALTLTGTAAAFNNYGVVGSYSVQMPVLLGTFLYVKNTGVNGVVVNYQPNGGSMGVVATLDTNGILIQAGLKVGFNALTISNTSGVLPITFDMIIGG